MRFAIPAAVLLLGCAVAGQEPAEKPDEVSFFADVQPLLRAACAGCHQAAKAEGDVVLVGHGAIVSEGQDRDALVVPGDPDASLLIQVVSGEDGEDPAMPEDGDPLTASEVAVLRQWIAEGAIDDSPASATAAYTVDRPPVYERAPVVTSLAFSPDGEALAVSGYHEVLLHSADGGEILGRLVGQAERIESVSFSPDGRSLAVAGGAPGRFGELQLWNVAKQQLRHSVTATNDSLFGVSWSPDGKLVAFGATDTASRAVVAATGEEVLYQSAHDDWVLDTVFSVDGSHLVTVSRDRSMKLILVAAQQFIDNITSITPGALRGGLMTVDRHPSRDELVVGGADGEPSLFRMYREKDRKIGDDYNRIRRFERMDGRVTAVEFDRAGARVVAGSSHLSAGQVRMYSVEDGQTLWTRELAGGVYTCAFRPDGAVVAAAGFGGVVHLLDAATGEVQSKFSAVPLRRVRTVNAADATLRAPATGEDGS